MRGLGERPAAGSGLPLSLKVGEHREAPHQPVLPRCIRENPDAIDNVSPSNSYSFNQVIDWGKTEGWRGKKGSAGKKNPAALPCRQRRRLVEVPCVSPVWSFPPARSQHETPYRKSQLPGYAHNPGRVKPGPTHFEKHSYFLIPSQIVPATVIGLP